MIKSVSYKVGRKGERKNIATHAPYQMPEQDLHAVMPVADVVGNELSVSPLDYQSLAEPISPNIAENNVDALRMGF